MHPPFSGKNEEAHARAICSAGYPNERQNQQHSRKRVRREIDPGETVHPEDMQVYKHNVVPICSSERYVGTRGKQVLTARSDQTTATPGHSPWYRLGSRYR